MKFEVIVLAAGQSRRFGQANKLLALVGGVPLTVGVVRQMTQVRVSGQAAGITVVTSTENDDIVRALAKAGLSDDVQIVTNSRALDGMGTSVAAGITNLAASVDAAVIVPGDMPFVGAPLIEKLFAAFIAGGAQQPVHPVLPDGTQTNPVVWPRAYFDRLAALDGDRGGKSLLTGANARTIPLKDPMEAADIDTPEDLSRLAES